MKRFPESVGRAGVLALSACLFGCVTANAQPPADKPADGTLGRVLFGPGSNLKLGGWVEVGAVVKDTMGQDSGLGNSPMLLNRDNWLQLNQATLYFEKGIQSNIIPRVTPTPAPVFKKYSFGFYADILVGRDGQPMQTYGYDTGLGPNKSGNNDPTKAASDKRLFLVQPQAYLQAYLPWGLGTAMMLGNFFSPVGNEIGYNLQPGPNIFYSRTYSFTSAPIKHTGLLIDTNLVKSASSGLLAAEFGLVQGWSNFKDNNNQPAYIGALRYRTPTMATWIDWEFITGASQTNIERLLADPSGVEANIPVTRVISPRNQNKTQHFVTVSHDWGTEWHLVLGANYGRQEGDGAADTLVVPGMAGKFTGATWGGAEAQLRHSFSSTLSVAGRVEIFSDRDGFALFPNTLAAGDFTEVTLGAQWRAHKSLLIRPEIRGDRQSNAKGLLAFNNGKSEAQTSFNVDVVYYF